MNPGITSKYFTGTNTFFARLAEGILRWRWLLLILISLLTIFAFYEMRTLRMDNSNESFFLEGDPTKLLLNKFRHTFGNDDFIYVLVEIDDFFRADTIRLIKTLAQDLEAHVPHIKDMKFLGNVEYVEGVEGGIRTTDLIEELDAWRQHTTGTFVLQVFQGDHFFIKSSQSLLLDSISRVLAQHLSRKIFDRITLQRRASKDLHDFLQQFTAERQRTQREEKIFLSVERTERKKV